VSGHLLLAARFGTAGFFVVVSVRGSRAKPYFSGSPAKLTPNVVAGCGLLLFAASAGAATTRASRRPASARAPCHTHP